MERIDEPERRSHVGEPALAGTTNARKLRRGRTDEIPRRSIGGKGETGDPRVESFIKETGHP